MNCLLCGEIIIPKITLRELCFWTVPMNQPICEECLKSITPSITISPAIASGYSY